MSKKFLIIITLLFLSLGNVSVAAQLPATNSIDIKTIDNQDELLINYRIEQVFSTNQNRGIFLSLPKFNNGQWINYQVQNVTKSTITNPTPSEEPYSIIHEQNQLRFRVGQEDVFLQPDTYIYNFTIAADINPNYKVEPTLLRDWLDPIDSVTLNGQTICQDSSTCNGVTVTSAFNSDKDFINPIIGFFNYIRAYLLSLIGVSLISYLLWRIFSKDPTSRAAKDSTELEPPQDLLPWQSHFILSEGKVDLKKTLISYLLWLNHKKYISITPKEKPTKKDSIDIAIQQDLPSDVLPAIFNKAVQSMATQGVSKGLKSSKINPGQHAGKLHKHIYQSVSDKYSKKPLHEVFAIWLLISFFLVIAVILILSGLQETLLIGDSWILFGAVSTLFFLPYLLWILSKWGNLNRSGIATKDYVKGYRHYLDYVVKEKIEFSNNPTDGVQYYLKNVPYAASFGLLAGFNKYFHKLFPQDTSINNTTGLATSFNSARFYTPPSSSSSSGGYSGGGGGFSGGGGSW